MSESKSPNHVDKIVGQRIRWRRRDLRITQERLGELINVSFQQIQKYEKGTNRISAGRLFELSGILGVGINYFFEGIDTFKGHNPRMEIAESDTPIKSPTFGNDEMDLMAEFVKIQDRDLKRSIIANVRAISASLNQQVEPRSDTK